MVEAYCCSKKQSCRSTTRSNGVRYLEISMRRGMSDKTNKKITQHSLFDTIMASKIKREINWSHK